MLIAPTIHLSTRSHPETPRGDSSLEGSQWELALRYLAATAATLLAIAGAQLIVANSFIYLLVALTLVGVPVSIFLRLSDMKVGPIRISRPLWNSLTVLSTFGAAMYYVFWSMRDFLMPLLSGHAPSSFWANFGPSEPVSLLMQVFLLFAAFRSFAIISDKDATLTTVPSFSVLLLLIPLHKNIEVVLYFIAWIFVAALLFALDHRSEVRAGVDATISAIVPGQDARLGARSLATVLLFSLGAAVGISFFLTSRDPNERSSAESAITALANRLTNLMNSTGESGVNSGPEREIDFTAGPPLPSRQILWQVHAQSGTDQAIYPTYWRLFALNTYNGQGWSQREDASVAVPRSDASFQRPPSTNPYYGGQYRRGGWPTSSTPQFSHYDVKRTVPEIARQFGVPVAPVRQTLIARVANLGFIPVQPGVRAVILQESSKKEVRLRRDGALDVGVVQPGQGVRVVSDLPALPEYGISRAAVPLQDLSASQIAASRVAISPATRRANLQLPPALPARVRNLGRALLKGAAPGASNYARAHRLAVALQENAVYTLRPPVIPEGRDATDYFLFEGARRGYCTYFAGALTVLCRTQGIPARVVSGFAGTSWQGTEAGLLREANAHAWTEVWVEGFGWAIVDATPSTDRGDNSPTLLENGADYLASKWSIFLLWARHRPAVLALLGVALLVPLGIWRGRNRFNFPFSATTGDDVERRVVSEIYRRTARTMARKFRPKSHWETPDEWLQSFAPALAPSDAEELRQLTSLYLAARYGARPLPRGSATLAREIAARIGWKRIKRD